MGTVLRQGAQASYDRDFGLIAIFLEVFSIDIQCFFSLQTHTDDMTAEKFEETSDSSKRNLWLASLDLDMVE